MQSEVNADWAVVQLIDERTGEASIGIEFPTLLHGTKFAVLDSDLAENPAKARLELKRKGAHLSGKKKDQLAFVGSILASLPRAPVMILACKPGFRKEGFVLGPTLFGEAATHYRWPQSVADSQVGRESGSKAAWDATVGRVAQSSSYLTVAIGIALAACLPSYYRKMGATPPISETATTNFSGESGTGRTTLSKTAAGVFGAPEPLHKWDFTRRGLEEICESRNDLLVVLDDTEKHTGEHMTLKAAIRMVNQLIPDGTSKIISTVAKKNGLPDMQWSTFAISSSPRPLDQIAEENGWTRSKGEKVRNMDVPVPERQRGGIFDNLTGSVVDRIARGKELMLELEPSIAANAGVVLPPWIQYLLGEDRTPQLTRLVERFVGKVAPASDGWDERFARKWGLIYAALKLAQQAGILPFPKGWPAKATSRCYHRCLRSVETEELRVHDKLRLLSRAVRDERLFPAVNPSTSRVLKFRNEMLGVRTRLGKNVVYGVRDDRLRKFAGSNAIGTEMIKLLSRHGALAGSQGHARTLQLQLSIRIDRRLVKKPRFLVIDAKRFKSVVRHLSPRK